MIGLKPCIVIYCKKIILFHSATKYVEYKREINRKSNERNPRENLKRLF